jgi:hypothetical protein
VWGLLVNAQKKELLRSLISHVILKRPVPDQIEVRMVWISGYYSDMVLLTPVHREQDVTGYDEMVARIKDLWQKGYTDEQMAEQLTVEGFHSARSPHVTPTSVMKIRLARKWYLAFERRRRGEKVDGYFTVRELAKHLEVNISTVYRSIYKQIVPPEFVERGPLTGGYLIRNEPQLIDQLQQRIALHKRRNGTQKSA